jgi:hypothetical protein
MYSVTETSYYPFFATSYGKCDCSSVTSGTGPSDICKPSVTTPPTPAPITQTGGVFGQLSCTPFEPVIGDGSKNSDGSYCTSTSAGTTCSALCLWPGGCSGLLHECQDWGDASSCLTSTGQQARPQNCLCHGQGYSWDDSPAGPLTCSDTGGNLVFSYGLSLDASSQNGIVALVFAALADFDASFSFSVNACNDPMTISAKATVERSLWTANQQLSPLDVTLDPSKKTPIPGIGHSYTSVGGTTYSLGMFMGAVLTGPISAVQTEVSLHLCYASGSSGDLTCDGDTIFNFGGYGIGTIFPLKLFDSEAISNDGLNFGSCPSTDTPTPAPGPSTDTPTPAPGPSTDTPTPAPGSPTPAPGTPTPAPTLPGGGGGGVDANGSSSLACSLLQAIAILIAMCAVV